MAPQAFFRRTPNSWFRPVIVATLGLLPALASAQTRELDHLSPPALEQATEQVGASIAQILLDARLEQTVIGIHIIDLETGRELYTSNPDTPLNPASNTKLVTSAAALTQLGAEYRYATSLFAAADALEGPKLRGDLYLRGTGDPSLITEDLYMMARELRDRGIRRITGGITVDSTAFDRDELPPEFDQKQELAAYRAPSGATSVNFNTVTLRVQPARAIDQPPLASLDIPVRSIALVNDATTVPGTKHRLLADVSYDKSKMVIHLSGSIGIDATVGRYRYPIQSPSRYAGNVLASLLRERGIKLGRASIRFAETPEQRIRLATHVSAPLLVQLLSVNKYSNNFFAEQILKTLATDEPATFSNAIANVLTALRELGLSTEGVVLKNGSGLYDSNRISPRRITELLTAMYRDPRYRADFIASLSMMGVDGTTRTRLKDDVAERWVRVKTGTLSGVSALSGYVGANARKPIVFSILLNDLPNRRKFASRTAQNQIVSVLARYAQGLPLTEEAHAAK